jgi:hypothetical protein
VFQSISEGAKVLRGVDEKMGKFFNLKIFLIFKNLQNLLKN